MDPNRFGRYGLFGARTQHALKYGPQSVFVASADGGGGGGGGGDDKTFTQEDVNALLAKERKKLEDKFKDYDDLKTKAGEVDDLKTRLETLEEEKDLAGKTAEEKERARAEKERTKLLADLEEAKTAREEAEAKLKSEGEAHRMTKVRTRLGTELTAAGVFPKAAEDALSTMLASSELDFDEETGALKTLTLSHDGTRYTPDEIGKACESYLKAKPHFAKAPAGGAGTTPPTGGGGGHDDRPLHERPIGDLLKQDAQTRQSQ